MSRLGDYTVVGTAICGGLTLILGIILLFIFPSSAELSEGFRTPIIAFEFAKTESDLSFLAGMSEPSVTNRANMDRGHFWDMGFPFAYGGFIALLLLQLIGQGVRFAWLGVLIALSIIPFDINENLTLLKITDALASSASVELLLAELQLATWLKWGAIGLSIGVLALGFSVRKNYVSALLSYLASVGIGICWISGTKPSIAEAMSLMTFLFFLWFAVKAFIDAKQLSIEKNVT